MAALKLISLASNVQVEMAALKLIKRGISLNASIIQAEMAALKLISMASNNLAEMAALKLIKRGISLNASIKEC
eukprot:11628478-Karenia_brevis.AAC.1